MRVLIEKFQSKFQQRRAAERAKDLWFPQRRGLPLAQMFRKASRISPLRLGSSSPQQSYVPCIFSRSSSRASSLPGSSLELDPSYRQLLQDIDITLKKHNLPAPHPRKELEVLSGDLASHSHEITPDDWVPLDPSCSNMSGEEDYESEHRKSPATLFGSNQLGTVILPLELQNAINLLIGGKPSSFSYLYDFIFNFIQRGTSLKYELMPDDCSQFLVQMEVRNTTGTRTIAQNTVLGYKQRAIQREMARHSRQWLFLLIIPQ